MARHDTQPATLRAISQDNTASVQKLNEELRKLKEHTDREASEDSTTEMSVDNARKPIN